MLIFFFNDTATTEIYTLSLHDALPISSLTGLAEPGSAHWVALAAWMAILSGRSEEHTSELQSRLHLVCRLLLEKKKKIFKIRMCCNFVIKIRKTPTLTPERLMQVTKID